MGKILIIDDEETYRTQLSTILRSREHEVQTAEDGRQGIDIGTTFVPDVLVTDWRLLDTMSGLEVSETLRAANPGLQTVIITGYSSQDLSEDMRTGVFRVLEKPFGLDEFVDTVNDALRRHAESQ